MAEKTLPQSWTARIYWHKAFPFSLAPSGSANLREAQQGVLEQQVKASFRGRRPLLNQKISSPKDHSGSDCPALPCTSQGGQREPRLHKCPSLSPPRCSLPEWRVWAGCCEQRLCCCVSAVTKVSTRKFYFDANSLLSFYSLGNSLLSELLLWTWKRSGFFLPPTETAVLLFG